jgi:hypothetical protein
MHPYLGTFEGKKKRKSLLVLLSPVPVIERGRWGAREKERSKKAVARDARVWGGTHLNRVSWSERGYNAKSFPQRPQMRGSLHPQEKKACTLRCEVSLSLSLSLNVCALCVRLSTEKPPHTLVKHYDFSSVTLPLSWAARLLWGMGVAKTLPGPETTMIFQRSQIVTVS